MTSLPIADPIADPICTAQVPPNCASADRTTDRARDRARDHVAERPAQGVAVVSDRGLRRRRNEDAGRVAVAPGWVGLVVCDGVGSAPHSDRAADAAAEAGRAALLRARVRGRDLAGQLEDAVSVAAMAADACAEDVADDGSAPPATTFVAAVSDGVSVAAASVGDSRVYWLPDHGPAIALTRDDSFAAAQIALGTAPEDAHRGPFAHVITRWLGASSPAVDVRVTTAAVNGPGWLLACSDGLWGYLPTGWDLGTLAQDNPDDGLALAERLVGWANLQGGRDNVTVALARIRPAASMQHRGAA